MENNEDHFEWERWYTDKQCVQCHRDARYYKHNDKTYLIHTVLCKKHYKIKRRKEARDANRQLN